MIIPCPNFPARPLQDKSIANDFIVALIGSKDDRASNSAPMRFRMIHDSERGRASHEFSGTLDECWPRILELQSQGYGCFYFMNWIRDLPDGTFATDADVQAVRVFAADFDHGIPEEWEWHLHPDLLVYTSEGRGQALWRNETTLPPSEFKSVQRRLIAHYGSDPAVQNLSRILRLPGTLHLKREPRLVTFWNGGWRSPRTDVTADLPALPEVAVSGSTGRPVEFKHLVALLKHVDPNVEYPYWRDIVAAIRATNAGTEDERLALADAWSRGELTGDFVEKYDGPDEVNRVWETMPPKAGGIGYGSILVAARERGYDGPSAEAPTGNVRDAFSGVDFSKWLEKEPPADAGEWRLFSDILKEPVVPVQELVGGLIEKGIVNFLNAIGGASKSRLAIQIGTCIDAGVPVFGRSVERSSFIYLSGEDSPEEVGRRIHAICRRLKINPPSARVRDFTRPGKARWFAVVGDTVEPQDFYYEFVDHMRTIPGHKFVVVDSTYNFLLFTGNAKINEASVMAAIGAMQQLCYDADCTLLMLWHPSQAGSERGDASGWSVAWHNAPRSRLSLKKDEKAENTLILKVEKRNHAPLPKEPITLHWVDGVLLPITEAAEKERRRLFLDAIVKVAIDAAESGQHIQMQKRPAEWVFNTIERACGYKPTDHELKEALAEALHDRKIAYRRGGKGTTAGYVAREPSDEEDEAEEA